MAKKRLSNKNENDIASKKSRQKILAALQNGDRLRFNALQKATGLDTATLTKHLKKLTKGIVIRYKDTKAGEYPIPVYYYLDPNLKLERQFHEAVFEHLKDWDIEKGSINNLDIADYLTYLNTQLTNEVLSFLWHYVNSKNEVAFNQSIENYTLETYREYIGVLKSKVDKAVSNGVDVSALIGLAEKRVTDNFQRYCKDTAKTNIKRVWKWK